MTTTMRLNQYVAKATGLSRRAADKAIATGHVKINGRQAELGTQVASGDSVTLAGKPIALPHQHTYLVLHKPVGYVTTRSAQGSAKTVYDLLPAKYHELKPVGRLDKDSSGLLLLTNNGNLAHALTHPSSHKQKTYQIKLSKPLSTADKDAVESGIQLDDGPSRLNLDGRGAVWAVTMEEGRNRQIRRTFEALGYTVIALHRTGFGPLTLGDIAAGEYREISQGDLS